MLIYQMHYRCVSTVDKIVIEDCFIAFDDGKSCRKQWHNQGSSY